jgi:Condensation domain
MMAETLLACHRDIRLSPAQAWWLDGTGQPAPYWTLLACIGCRDRLNYPTLASAIHAVSEQHQAFRFGLQPRDGGWRGFLDTRPRITVDQYSITELTAAEQDRYLATIEPRLEQSLDPIDGPVARFIYVDRGAARPPLLWVVFNHLVCDHYSVLVLLGDIEQAYQQIGRGEPVHSESQISGSWLSACLLT